MRQLKNSLAFWAGVIFSVVALSLMFPGPASAQSCGEYTGTSYEYFVIPGGNGWCSGSGDQESPQAAMAWCQGQSQTNPSAQCHPSVYVCSAWGNWELGTFIPGSPGTYPLTASRQRCNLQGENCVTDTVNYQIRGPSVRTTNDPPPWHLAVCPQDCSAYAGVSVPMCWPQAESVPTSSQPEESGYSCAVSFTGPIVRTCLPDAGICCGTGVYSGESVAQAAGNDAAPDDPPVACVVQNGQNHCISAEDPNCGYVNGERWCASNVSGKTIMTAQGAVISDDAGAVVDDQGNPVAPDSTMEIGGDTSNYWGSGTVAANGLAGSASGNPDQSGSGVPGAGRSGDGGPGDGDGEGEGGDGEFSGPGLEDGAAYGDSLGGYWSDLSSGPWGTALDGLGGSVGGGACPVAEIPWLDGTVFTMDFHCTLLEDFEALIGLLFFFGWTWLAVRVLFSA